MKRIVILFLTASVGLSAQEIYLPVFQPFTPEVLAQGGSHVAVAQGWNALFSNPAGFSRTTEDAFYLTTTSSAFIRFQDLSTILTFIRDRSFQNFNFFAPPPNPVLDFATNLATENGLGFAQNLGMGYISRGLALAIVLDTNLYGKGDNLMSTNTLFTASASAIIGYAVALPFFFAEEPSIDALLTEDGEEDVVPPDLVLHLGGAVKISHYYYSEYSVLNILSLLSGSAFDSSHPVYTFPYFSVSLGTLLEWRHFTFGLSVTDLGNVDTGDRLNSFGDVRAAWFLPRTGTRDSQVFVQPVVVRAGIGWTPDLGYFAEMIEPTFHTEIAVPIKGIQTPTWLTWFHFGGEARLVDFFSIRAGWRAGNFTAGVGYRFFDLWEVNAAFSTEEVGKRVGEVRRSRFAIECAFKF